VKRKNEKEENIRNSHNESVIDKISSEIAFKVDDIKRKSNIDDYESIKFEGGESEDESSMVRHFLILTNREFICPLLS
jgi:hypothetical protein